MKCRLPAVSRISNKQRKACNEYLFQQHENSIRRLFKLFCITLNQDFGFGKNRLLKLLDSVSRLSAEHKKDEVYWEHIDRYLHSIGLDFASEEYEDIIDEWKNQTKGK